MRNLTGEEVRLVAGGTGVCTAESSAGNEFSGITNTGTLGQDLINIYEALVEVTSHIIERVANVFER